MSESSRVQEVPRVLEQVLGFLRTTRMPSIAICDSGMGKTMLMQKFCTVHPPGFDPEIEHTNAGSSVANDRPSRRTSVIRTILVPSRTID